MGLIWKQMDRVVNLGVHVGRRDSLNHRVRIANILALTSLLLAVGYVFLYLWLDQLDYVPHSAGTILLYCIPLVLNARGYITASRLFIVIMGTISISFFSSLYGRDSDFDQFFLSLVAGAWLYFDHNERLYSYLSTAIIIAAVIMLHLTDYSLAPASLVFGKPSGLAVDSFKVVVSASVLMSIILLSYLGSRAESRLEESLEEVKRDRARLQEQEMRLQASERLAAIGETAASIAHEINNPLAILRLQNERLARHLSKSGAPDSVHSATQRIEAMTVRISRIIRSMQTLARGTEAEPFIRAPVALLVQDALEFVEDKYRTADFEVRISHQAAALELDCRPIQISQVILNLLNNAWDSLKEKSRQDPEAPRFVEIRTECGLDQRRESLFIRITDSGIGILDEAFQRLGEPAFSTKNPGIASGMGFGLRISRSIVHSHSGALTVTRASDLPAQETQSLPEHASTCFTISLPLRQTQAT